MSQQTIIALIIAYTCVTAFVFTVIVELLSLIGVVKFMHPSQQNALFASLIVEIVGICIGTFTGFMRFDVSHATQEVEASARLNMDPAAAVYFQAGKDAFHDNPKLAEAKFVQASAIDPQNYAIRLAVGTARLQLENYASALPELEAARNLFDALPKERQVFSERLVIESNLIAGYSRNKNFTGVQNTIDAMPVNDVGGSLCALYINAADGMFQASNWTDAADYSSRARMIARAFKLYDYELTSLNTESNALYQTPGTANEQTALKLIEDGLNNVATYPLDSATQKIRKGELLNTRGLFRSRDTSTAGQEAAIEDFTMVINALATLVQLRDDCKTTLASAHGNRADCLSRLRKTVEADADRSMALNYFIQIPWKQGVSSQLTEYARELLADGHHAKEAYAAMIASVKLNGDKSASDRQEDNILLAQATGATSAGDQATAQSTLSNVLQSVTGVSSSIWKSNFQFP